MSWGEIIGHEKILERFEKSIASERLASTYLFVGPEGIGKRTFALKLAQGLLCESNSRNEIHPCGQCPCCQQVLASTHPDLIQIEKPANKNVLPLELFIGEKEKRRQEGLCHDISLKPFHGKRKVAIIDDADYLNAESANSLLKTLEDPPPNSILILLGTSEHRQLQTIISRSQVVRFQTLSAQQVLEILNRENLLETELPLEQIAAASGGSIQRAVKLSDPDFFEFRGQLLNQLATLDPGQGGFAKTITDFVDSTGKDASVRRGTLNEVANMSIEFFSASINTVLGTDSGTNTANSATSNAVDNALETLRSKSFNDETIAGIYAGAIDRTHSLQYQIFANAAAANIIPFWLSDLTKTFHGAAVPI